MIWYCIAGWACVSYAITNFIDKYLLSAADLSPKGITIFCGLAMLPVLVFVVIFGDLNLTAVSLSAGLLCFLSGVCAFINIYPYAVALLEEDASTVVPLYGFTSIIGIGFAVLALGESFTASQALGAVLIALGAFLLGIDRNLKGVWKPRPALWRMLFASFVYAFVGIFFRLSGLPESLYWSGTFWQLFGSFVAGVAVANFDLDEVKKIASLATRPVGWIYFICAILTAAGMLFESRAILTIGVAKVRVVISMQPVVVFIFGTVGTLLLPRYVKEPLTKALLIRKGICVALVVIGVNYVAW